MSEEGAPGLADAATGPDGGDVAMPEPQAAVRRQITEDWAATAIGLLLLFLAMAGVIAKGMVP